MSLVWGLAAIETATPAASVLPAALLSDLAYRAAGEPKPRDDQPHLLAGLAWSHFDEGTLFAGAAMLASFLVSYTRAKSESLGFTPGTGMANVGLMPREVRIVVLTIGLVLAGALGTDPTGDGELPTGIAALLIALVIITVGATFTAIQRIRHVIAQAGEG